MEGFLSYSHQDSARVDVFRRHLYPITATLGLHVWIDEEIKPGDKWDNTIRKAIASANLFLFCISADFLFSKYIRQVEMHQARAKYDRGEALIVPVIVCECAWEWVEVLQELQAVPKAGKPIQLWRPNASGYADAARRIGELLRNHRSATP